MERTKLYHDKTTRSHKATTEKPKIIEMNFFLGLRIFLVFIFVDEYIGIYLF